MTTTPGDPMDASARARALDPAQSFIVRAPAGSGKTELLTRRFLKLLSLVDEPEEILAITFTRAATAEMRGRVLRHLEGASRREPAPDEDQNLTLARSALARSESRGWCLLEQPHRLNIETIDSLSLRIAHNQPLLSRMGGAFSPSEHAAPLYAEAARRTLGALGSAGAELDHALAHLLQLRDNNLPNCENLLAGMLQRRDQWVRAFPLSGSMDDDAWDQARSRLEQPFREEVKRVHALAHQLMMQEPLLVSELFELAHYALDNGNRDLQFLAGIYALPAPETASAEHWNCICEFLLTQADDWRSPRGLTKSNGFPSTTTEQKRIKTRMGNLLNRLQQVAGLGDALRAIRALPAPRYDEDQWSTLKHIFVVLRRAVAELRVLFAQRNTVDFVELGLAAREVLRNSDADALLALSGNIRHILVDELQDTSRSQLDLLQLLIRAWEVDDSRTCFMVGDPMQSIYLFRQAEVELFSHIAANGLVSEEHIVPLELIELMTNFRSHAGLTTRWNEMFDLVFAPNASSDGALHVEYSHTHAAKEALQEEAVRIYPQIVGDGNGGPSPEDRALAREREAKQVLEIIAQYQDDIERANAAGRSFHVAVLARSRPHLAQIVALLRQRGVPFRAVDFETLNERQELIDLMSLTRALIHPMDRVAWLSVLRAPWCGLGLADLHRLTGADDPAFRQIPVLDLMDQQLPRLSTDGAERVTRVKQILHQAIAARFDASSFSHWIERVWRTLGGPHCVDAAAYENAQIFFTLLDAIAPDGMACLTENFEDELNRLFAPPDPRVSEQVGVQLMTIHKAKGLGFDVVIVPGLDRKPRQDDSPLICSLERTNLHGETAMLVAPIGYTGDDKHPTYAWVRSRIRSRADEELKRLLYVACTRARQSLHLLGTAVMTHSGLKPEHDDSLLATAWPALAPDFQLPAKVATADPSTNLLLFPSSQPRGGIFDIAAGVSDPASVLGLHRLRTNADLSCKLRNVAFEFDAIRSQEPQLLRPHGSRDARQTGNVVHAMLQRLSEGASLDSLSGPVRVLLRAAAYSGKALEDAAGTVLRALEQCLADPDGAWILGPHLMSQSEASWTALSDGALKTLRADRVFIAGPLPHTTGEDHLWIIDYKMSAPAGDEDFLARERQIYAPQLTGYARALREAERITLPIRFGLYYPRLGRLDWWSDGPDISE